MATSASSAKAAVMKLAADVEEARKARNVELSGSGAVNKIAETASKPDGGKYEFSVARKLIGHLGKVYAQNWAGHEARMVSASQDGKLIDWNALENTKVHLVNLVNAWVMTCGFDQSDSPRYVASGGLDNACTIFDVTADMPSISESKCVLEAHDGYLSCCRFVNNSSIVTSSGDSTCIVWDVETARESQRFPDHAGDVMGVSIRPDNPSQFVSGSTDTTAILWDVRAGRSVASFVGHEGDINAVDFMRNGMAFATASDDSTVRIFDIRAMACVSIFNGGAPATSVACSKSSKLVVAGFEDATARGWQTLSTKSEPTIELHHELPVGTKHRDDSLRISCVGFNRSGRSLCTGSWDNTLSVWAQKMA